MSDLQQRLKALSPKQQQLLLQRLNKRTGKTKRETTKDVSLMRPLSYGLQRAWFQEQLQASQQVQHTPLLMWIHGPLHLPKLQQTLRQVRQRQPGLCTVFVEQDGQLFKKIDAKAPVNINVFAGETPVGSDNVEQAIKWVKAEAQRPFDPVTDSRLKVHLIRLDNTCHLLALTLHYSVADPRNSQWLAAEIATSYLAPQTPEAEVKEPTGNWLDGDKYKRHVDFWQNHLAQTPPTFSLTPETRQNPITAIYHGITRQLNIPNALKKQLQSLSKQANQSLRRLLLAVFQILVAGYTSQTDVVTGVYPLALAKGNEYLLDFFPDVLVVRSLLSGDLSFHEALSQIGLSYEAAKANAMPLEQLIDSLLPKQTANQPTLIQTLFDYRSESQHVWESADVWFELAPASTTTTDYVLSLVVWESAEHLSMDITFRSDLFTLEKMDEFLNDLKATLAMITAVANTKLRELPGWLRSSPQAMAATPPVDPQKIPTYKTVVEEVIAHLWADTLKRADITPKSDFYALGGDKLGALRVQAFIRKYFDIALAAHTLRPGVTLTQLIHEMHQQQKAAAWFQMETIRPDSPLTPIHTDGQKPPLFLAHPLGGDVGFYAMLTRYLGKDQPLYGLQAQGMDGLKPPRNNINQMAQHYLEAICEIQPQGPYYLAGWSLGGLLSLEMARQLHNAGEVVALVALFDTIANWIYPPVVQRKPPSRSQSLREGFDKAIPISLEEMASLSPSEQLIYILDELQKLGSRPSGLSILQWLDLFSVREQNLRAIYSYVPQPYTGKLITFYALDSYLHDPAEPVRWSEITGSEDIEVELVTGDHINIFSEPHFRLLAQQFKVHLDNAQQSHIAFTQATAEKTVQF